MTRQGLLPPLGFVLAEVGLRDPVLGPFLAFFEFRKIRFWRGGSRKMRQVRFPPFGFGFSEFGLRELRLEPRPEAAGRGHHLPAAAAPAALEVGAAGRWLLEDISRLQQGF